MNRRLRSLTFMFCVVLGLFLVVPVAKAQSQQVSLGVSVVERKTTDTQNDFDFSYNDPSSGTVLGEGTVEKRVNVVVKVVGEIYKIIKGIF